MKLSNLMRPDLIRCGLSATSREDAIRELASLLAERFDLDGPGRILEALNEREKLGPFSCGRGIAFPHARTNILPEFSLAIGTSREGIDFEAPDGKPIHVVILFVIPKRHANLYLQTFATFLNFLGKSANYSAVVNAGTPEELIEAFASGGARVNRRRYVRDHVREMPPTLSSNDSLKDALAVFCETRSPALAVTDESGRLIGRVGLATIFNRAAQEQNGAGTETFYQHPDPLGAWLSNHPEMTIEAFVDSQTYNISDDTTVTEAAARMANAGDVLAFSQLQGTASGMIYLQDCLDALVEASAP